MARQPLKRELAAQNEALRAELSQVKHSRDLYKEAAESYNREIEGLMTQLEELRKQAADKDEILEPWGKAPSTRKELMEAAKRFSTVHKVPTRIEDGVVKYFSNGHWHTAS